MSDSVAIRVSMSDAGFSFEASGTVEFVERMQEKFRGLIFPEDGGRDAAPVGERKPRGIHALLLALSGVESANVQDIQNAIGRVGSTVSASGVRGLLYHHLGTLVTRSGRGRYALTDEGRAALENGSWPKPGRKAE